MTVSTAQLAAGGRLTLNQLAYLRAIAQGLSIDQAARRYLEVQHGAAVRGAHQLLVDHVAAVVRRRGDSRWRLLGLVLEDPPAEQLGPPLQEWAEAQGLDGWSERELQEMYVERFGAPTAGSARRIARNARLRVGRLALLRELEQVAAVPASPGDLIEGWLVPEIAGHLRRLGLLTLTDLQRRIQLGGRWWRGIPAYGPVKAGRLSTFVASLIGVSEPHRWTVPSERAAELDGSRGSLRAPGPAATGAANDHEAINAWIEARARSPATERSYQREAERFLLWMIVERGRSMSDATVEDCGAYIAFARDPPDRWVSRRHAVRLGEGWAPFRGPLGMAAVSLATTALHSLFDWLVKVRYLALNPWAAVNRRLGDDPRADLDVDPSRAFTPKEWKALQAQLEREPNAASAARLTWLLVFGQATGLRPSELVAARRGDLRKRVGRDGGSAWFVRVHGKGRKNRLVVVPSAAITATRRYFEARGAELDAAQAEAPLLAALAGGATLGYRSLHETLTRFIRRALAASSLTLEERQHAKDASSHWLRHTHATRAAESGVVPLDVLQENLGHEDPRTTSRYYRAQIERRQAALEKAFGGGEDKTRIDKSEAD